MSAPARIPEVELSARIARLHPLLERAEPQLEALCEALEPGPYGVAVVDRDGVALWSRHRGTSPERHGLGEGVDCAALFAGQGGQRPAELAGAEPFRVERQGFVHWGEPIAAGDRAPAWLVMCEPAGMASGRTPLLRLAARAIGRMAAGRASPASETQEQHALWLAAIMKQIPAAMAVLDARTGRVVMASKHAEELFGGSLPDLNTVRDPTCESPLRPRHPDGRPFTAADQPLFRVARTGEAVRDLEMVVQVGPGRDARILLSVVPILEGGQAGVLVLTFEDVTLRRAAEQERESILAAERAARESAEASARIRERMVAALGHDLRQPLAAIMLALDALECEGLDDGPRSILRKTRRSAGRIEAMIRDLLDFSVSAAGLAIHVAPQEADLRGIAESVIEELQVVDPKLQVKVRVAGDLRGSWDEGRLEQVITNLVANAARYGEPGAPVEVRLAGDDAEVSVEVRNRGEPIPAQVQDRLFLPFVRASRKGPGLGLGLFIVRELARAHGGTVALRSSLEEGTVFTVNLPRRCRPLP